VNESYFDRLRSLRVASRERAEEIARDPDTYWALAARAIHWQRPWERVFEQSAERPWEFAYFKGGELNACENAVDRHVKAGQGARPALIWESDPANAEGDSAARRVLSFAELYERVQACAAAYRQLGLKRGDRIALYLPNVPETTIAMLAAARLGIIYTAVFPGLSAEELRYRIDDLGASLVITSDVGYRRGEEHPYKGEIVDKALPGSGVRQVIVVDRSGRRAAPMSKGRDLWWDEVVTGTPEVPCEPLDAEHPLFVLYTSGSTGKPKGAVHTTGGYCVGLLATLQAVFEAEPGRDVLFTYADPGWITGQSYTNYAPLLTGIPTVLYEGVPDHPQPDRFFRIVERHKVTLFKVGAPGLRLAMRYGAEWPRRYDLSSLRFVCSCAEPLDPVVQSFVEAAIGPLVNAYWKTEDGGIHFAPLGGAWPQRPDASTHPLPWTRAKVMEADENGKGMLVTRTHPYMMRTLWNDAERYVETYWSRFPGWFLTGDFAIEEDDGYLRVPGRSDDVIKISGHRVGTREVEECLIRHPAVAEAIAIGIPNGQDPNTDTVVALVVPRPEVRPSLSLDAELARAVREGKGALVRLDEIFYSRAIPRTKSGKNLRRVLKLIAQAPREQLRQWARRQASPEVGNLSTLENWESILAVVDAVAERREIAGREEVKHGSPAEVDAAWYAPPAATLSIGAPFRPGLDPLPGRQRAWAVVKDRWGRPAHGEPREALRQVTVPVPAIGPNEALGYVLYAGLTYNTLFAARGVPVSVFDMHDCDLHVPGSGAVVLVAALGSETAREGRLKIGELRVLYPGVSDLLSPRAGEDPMHADFRIQGYETPDGSFAQFVRCQAPQLLAHSERLTLPEGSSFMLDLETVYKAIFDVARVQEGERVFVEGAAGGTGLYAVACAALRGARVTGLVSTEEKGGLVLRRGGQAYVNRKDRRYAGTFTPAPADPSAQAGWIAAGAAFRSAVGGPIDVVVSSVGRDLFGRMVDLLAPGGRLVFYGATSGYTLAFLGKPGKASAQEMLRRAGLRPNHGVLVHAGGENDAVAREAIEAALRAGARVVAVARKDAEAARLQETLPVQGVVSLETLARNPGFRWPETMPDSEEDPDGFREYQDYTLKPFGQAIGRILATPDNPRGYPDVVVERAGQDTLGVSAFLARPHTGAIVFLEAGEGRRFSFYAPNVWMHQKRILFPSFSILGSHLSNAHQADEVVRLIDGGALRVHAPALHAWEETAREHQAMHENRHSGTLAMRVGATRALDGARTARQVYEAWGSRYFDSKSVRVRFDPLGPDLVALVTIDSPPANALGRAVLEDLERALEALEKEPRLRAAVITGAGPMFVAGADIRQLRTLVYPEEAADFASRAQRTFQRLARLPAPAIAAVDGYALGGGNELAMACAYRVGSARAELGQPEINLHLIPGFGGTQSLPRLCLRKQGRRGPREGLLEALGVLLDGRRRTAARALELGLLDEIAPADALSHALGIARRIAEGRFQGPLWSPLADESTMEWPDLESEGEIRRLLGHHERIPRSGPARSAVEVMRLGLTLGLAKGLEVEAREFGRLVTSEEGRAGIDRFLARRSLALPLRAGDR